MSKFNKLNKLRNAITAMITPLNEDFSIDEAKYREFIKFQIENGCQPLTTVSYTHLTLPTILLV